MEDNQELYDYTVCIQPISIETVQRELAATASKNQSTSSREARIRDFDAGRVCSPIQSESHIQSRGRT